ncbi:MAG: hypothetical protein D6730_14835 [Bacteroidetes bacterium]|nr:MAG: hypothetical protein D6730_14835 [Bacteroidota bacterium]
MDSLFLIELGIVAIIVLVQFYVFMRNNSGINQLANIYPDARSLKTTPVPLAQAEGPPAGQLPALNVIEEDRHFSPEFREIVHHTNAYLQKNKGEADFDVLKEIAAHKDESAEKAIESGIALPLYIGLLCTFAGVIIGLVKISMVGVSDAAIQSFIGGVLIGMVGSANGLALTIRSNHLFKERKKMRDRAQYDYFTFLRTHILPALKKHSETPISTLRENLQAFNESFVNYQDNVKASLKETLELFGELKEVFQQIRTIEKGINGMGHFIQSNNGLIEKQVAYIDAYVEKAENFSRKLGSHFQQTDRQIAALVQENIAAIERSTKAAYVKMDQYLSQLDNDASRNFVDTLNQDLDSIRQSVNGVHRKNAEINAKLLDQLGKDAATNQQLAQQMQQMNDNLQKLLARQDDNFTQSFGFKLFVTAGSVAFILGIIGGVVFLLNTFAG